MVLLALGKMKQLAGVIRGEKQGSGCANTALVFHAGKLLALHEADLPYALRMTCEVCIQHRMLALGARIAGENGVVRRLFPPETMGTLPRRRA